MVMSGRVVKACLGTLIAVSLVLTAKVGGSSQNSDGHTQPGVLPPIIRGNEAIDIVATVVAMSRDLVTPDQDGEAYISVLRIDKVLSGTKPGRFVRADFASHYIYIDPKYGQLRTALMQDQRIWKIHLRPAVWGSECAWAIPVPPWDGKEYGYDEPIMVSVGRPSAYPNINTLTCYAFGVKDVQEGGPPTKAK